MYHFQCVDVLARGQLALRDEQLAADVAAVEVVQVLSTWAIAAR